jgi:hypothetical protein
LLAGVAGLAAAMLAILSLGLTVALHRAGFPGAEATVTHIGLMASEATVRLDWPLPDGKLCSSRSSTPHRPHETLKNPVFNALDTRQNAR